MDKRKEKKCTTKKEGFLRDSRKIVQTKSFFLSYLSWLLSIRRLISKDFLLLIEFASWTEFELPIEFVLHHQASSVFNGLSLWVMENCLIFYLISFESSSGDCLFFGLLVVLNNMLLPSCSFLKVICFFFKLIFSSLFFDLKEFF